MGNIVGKWVGNIVDNRWGIQPVNLSGTQSESVGKVVDMYVARGCSPEYGSEHDRGRGLETTVKKRKLIPNAIHLSIAKNELSRRHFLVTKLKLRTRFWDFLFFEKY